MREFANLVNNPVSGICHLESVPACVLFSHIHKRVPLYALTQQSSYSQLLEQVNNVRMVVVWTGKHPWLYPGWKILPTMMGYCSSANNARCFQREDNNVDLTPVQPHYYCVRQVEPCQKLG